MKGMNYFISRAMETIELDPTDPNDLKAIADEIIRSNFNFDVSENSSENPANAEDSSTAEDPATVQATPIKPDMAKNPSASKNTTTSREINLVVDLINNNLVQGFIMSEILGPPKGKKLRGTTIWNSRF